MKIRKTSRITALVLALMMIVPLISVPAFAVDSTITAEPAYSEDFTSVTDLGTVLAGAYPNTAVVENTTFDETHGNALKVDLTVPGYADPENPKYYIKAQNNNNNWPEATITDFAEQEDGSWLFHGNVTIGGNTYYFYDAEINYNDCSKTTKLYKTERVENEDGTYTYGDQYKYSDSYTTFPLVDERVKAVYHGKGMNVAVPNYVSATNGLTGTEFVFQADYYFAEDIANKEFDMRILSGSGNIETVKLKTTATGITVNAHPDTTNNNILLFDPSNEKYMENFFRQPRVAIYH